MFEREKVVSAVWTFVAFIKKTAWISLIFVFGGWIYLTGKNAGTAEAIMFQQNIGMSVSSTAVVMWMLYWWQLDSADDTQRELKELKKQNKALEDRLNSTHILVQQLVDKANHPMPNSLSPKTNPATIPPSSNQTVMISNGHGSNGN